MAAGARHRDGAHQRVRRDGPRQSPDPEADRRRARFRELNRKPPEQLTDDEKKELQERARSFFGSFRRFREFELTRDLRRAMRRETEMLFEHIVREDRSLLELLDCDYTFLNERLAKHYGIEGVKGDEMRRVTLPAGSPRGGVLTQGTVLAVTSNPDRTSPVKRGLFILDNILGSPPAPPPPNIPPLEESGKKVNGRTSRRCGSRWLCTAARLRAPPATPGWTRWAWPWRTSTRWGGGATRSGPSRSTPPAS